MNDLETVRKCETQWVVAGQGTAWAFILVALAFLGAVMLVGRMLAVWATRLADKEAPAAPIAPHR